MEPKEASASTFRRQADWWIYCLLLAATLAVYAQALRFDFVNIDDPEYVTENAYVRQGITKPGLVWALTSAEAANWFPLTRFSHMLDVQFFGLNSGLHHLTNLLLHALAVLLLYAFLHRATGTIWASAFVAFVFALHPLHVESVAWIAERKDVLSAAFWMLALYGYIAYTEKPGWFRYTLVLLAFVLGLMAKPMVVTLPFVLLLLDVWPLQRTGKRPIAALLLEKLPFFALSAVAAAIAYFAQQRAGAVKALSGAPMGLRVENALVSYMVYIGQMFWPARLAAFYPYPESFAVWQTALAGVLLAACSIFVLRSFRTRPYLVVGWFWYLGTLVPVIGLVQVGSQSRADRYTYIPMVGLSIMLAWGVGSVAEHWPRARHAVRVSTAAACLSMAVLSSTLIENWRNSETLFRHALAVTERNSVAHNNLAMALAGMPERLPEAIAEYQAALAIQPDHAEARNNYAAALSRIPGRRMDAIGQYEMALRIKPDYAEAQNNLGAALLEIPERIPEAIAHLEAALRIRPGYEEAHNNLAIALSRTPGRTTEAIAQFEMALRLAPDDADAHYNLGIILARTPGRVPDAVAHLETTLRIRPDYAPARQWLEHLRAAP